MVLGRVEALEDRKEAAGLPHHSARRVDVPVELGRRDVAPPLRHGSRKGPRRLGGASLGGISGPTGSEDRRDGDCGHGDGCDDERRPHLVF